MGSQRVGGDWATFTFPDGSAGKESGCIAGDIGNTGSILWSGRSSTGGNGNPFQSSCLKNPMDRGTWWATVQRVAESQTQLSDLNTHIMLLVHKINPTGFPDGSDVKNPLPK